MIDLAGACRLAVLSTSIALGSFTSDRRKRTADGRATGRHHRGFATGSGAAFKGVPFAQPPVGPLRWRDPQPVKPWKGVLQTTEYAKSCAIEGGEDCLYLNIWTPQWPVRSRLPVMLWFPSGGNFTGASSDARYQSLSIPQHGVILVSAQYRLSIFGFLAHPALSAESPHHTSGNYGLLDMIAAMHWVRDNIARFGGDPDNVTVWGESSTSLDLNVLLTSPLERGLFKRQITESGPVVDPPALAAGERKGVETMAKAGIGNGPDALAKMRALSAADIWKLNGTALSWVGPDLGVLVDGYVLPRSPFAVFQDGRENRVPLLMGNNARELQKPFFPMPNGLAGAIDEIYGPLAPQARAVYGVATMPEPPPGSAPRAGTCAICNRYAVPLRHGCRIALACARRQYRVRVPIRSGAARERGERRGPRKRIAVCLRHLRGDGAVKRYRRPRLERQWSSIGRTSPKREIRTARDLPQWPAFDLQSRSYLEFTDAGPIARQNLRKAACELYAQALMPAGG